MERIAADKLNKAICFWLSECTRIEEIKRMKWHDELLPDELKKQWADTDYKQLYADFEAELISNIREYRNAAYMHSYMEGAFTCLDDCDIDDYLEHGIIRNGFEVRFLLEVLKQTRQYFQKVTLLYESDEENDNYSEAFKTIFYDAMILIDPLYSNDYFVQLKEQEEAEYCFPASGIRTSFNFEELKTELATTNSNEEKIKLIHETLIDYEQYFITLDAEYRLDILGSRRVVGSDFYRLCKAELRRYEDEKAENIAAAVIEKIPGADTPYRWVASNTDLLELVVALMEEGAIQRMDGEKLSRKELIDSACRRLNIEIKDAEGKLNKATARKSNLTPFLDKLKHSFVNYVNQKDEKQQKRR